MTLERTGGGFLRSGRMGGDLPSVQPMKPMPPVPTAPQGPAQTSQGGYLGPQGAPPQQPAPMPQGQPQPAPQEQQGPAINDVANNALMLLHDEEAGPAFEQMIAQGVEGAAQAIVQLYSQVREGYESQGQPIDEEMSGEAAQMVIKDIADIGKALGSIQSEDDIDDMVTMSLSTIAQQFPDVAESMQAMVAEMAPEDIERGQAIAQRASGRMGGMTGAQPTGAM